MDSTLDFHSFPFGLPSSAPDAEKVWWFAKTGFGLQQNIGVSNACGFVNVILQRCLNAVGIEAQLIYGTVDISGMKMPHAWLEVGGHIIDNTYCEDIPLDIFASMKQKAKYSGSIADKSEMYLGDHVTKRAGIDDHDVNHFQWMFQNPDKALSIMQNKKQLFIYYHGMCASVRARYKKELPEITNTKCWGCDRDNEGFKSCAKCKVAIYCSKKCQLKDWKAVHKSICLPPKSY